MTTLQVRVSSVPTFYIDLQCFLQYNSITLYEYGDSEEVFYLSLEEVIIGGYMLLLNKSGRIYDVPEKLANQYIATKMGQSREELDDLLSTLRKPVPASAGVDSECGCCCIYSNYCPNK